MKTVDNMISTYLNKEQGVGLAICPTESMKQILKKNNAILSCDILSAANSESGTKRFCKKKYFSFKKMRKKFKKKTKHFIVADIKELETHFNTFISDSIYITNGTLYLYILNVNYDVSRLQRRYQRFHASCDMHICKDGIVLKIDVGNIENHYWKEKCYYIVDTVADIIDEIGDIFAS